jgi:hypothetical protein
MIPLNNLLILPKHEDYFIYGFGSCAKHLHSILTVPQKKNFQGFIHKDRSVKIYNDFVYSIDEFLSKSISHDTLIIIASSYWKEISKILLENSYIRLFVYPFINFEKTEGYPSYLDLNNPIVEGNGFLRSGYNNEETLREIALSVEKYTMVTYDGLLSLADITRHICKYEIHGDFVELGCHKGGSVGVMAKSILEFTPSKKIDFYNKIHAFDSFEGLPEPDKTKDNSIQAFECWKIKDNQMSGNLNPVGELVASEDSIKELIFEKIKYPRNKLEIHKGWFQDTVPRINDEIGKIALLRLDGDLYESTYIGLKYFYPKLVHNGFLILDDWCLEGARNAVQDYFDENNIKLHKNRVDGTVCYWIKN